MKNNLWLTWIGLALLIVLGAGCRPSGPVEYDQRQRVVTSSAVCDAAGVAAPCLRIMNSSEQHLGQLKLYFASESVEFGDVPAGSFTPYIHVSRGVYSYGAFTFMVNGALKEQGVADFVGEVPLKGGAFTYILGYDANYKGPLYIAKITDDQKNSIVRERPTTTPKPDTQPSSAEHTDNTIDCFTAEELAEAVFRGYQHEQRTGGDAPFIDEEGVLHLHTTASEFEGDTGHRLLVHDAPVASYDEGFGFMRGSNKWLNISVVELTSRFAERSCDNDRSTLPGLEAEIEMAPLLGTTDLAPYRWENRLLLLFAPMPMGGEYTQTMVAYEGLKDELLDRNMLWFHILTDAQDYVDEGQRPVAKLPVELSSALVGMYNPESAPFLAVLIGKDGGVKHTTSNALLPAELFSIIDAMPMRQQEMRENASGK